VLVRDVADLRDSTMPGEDDRYNGIPRLSLIANVYGEDLGRVANHIDQAIKKVNEGLWAPAQSPSGEEGWKNEITGDIVNQKERPTERPRGVEPTIRGQIVPMRDMFQGLALGLGMAVVVIFLLLTAYFQSLRLAFIVISTAPAVIAGVALALIVTRTTLNIQSFMGSIMAVGVAVANAILLATFAERARTQGVNAFDAAVDGGRHRLRPILMTSCAMIAGMVPMALALGEGGEQTAPLGRAVIGGLAVATLATLWAGTTWYFVGRGLSEVAAAGWAFIASLLLLNRRASQPSPGSNRFPNCNEH